MSLEFSNSENNLYFSAVKSILPISIQIFIFSFLLPQVVLTLVIGTIMAFQVSVGDAAAAYSAWQIIGCANYCSGIITNDEDNEARYHVTCDLRHRH